MAILSGFRAAPLWMRIGLLGSVALNLMVVGLIAGAIARGKPDGVARGADDAVVLRQFARALPEAQEKQFRRDLRAYFMRNRSELRGLPAERAQMIAAISAEPLDIDTLRDLFTKQRGRLDAVQTAAQEAFLKQIEGLTPSERIQFVENLSAPPKDRDDRRDGPHPDGRPPRP